MAKDKKSFIMYADQIDVFGELSDELAGKLIKHVLKYVNDENPVTSSPILKIAFAPIKSQLKRDLKNWEQIREKRSKAGKISAEIRQQKATNSTRVKSVQHNSTHSTVNDTVNVTVNDTVNVIEEKYNILVDKSHLDYTEEESKKLIELLYTELINSYTWFEKLMKSTGLKESELKSKIHSYLKKIYVDDEHLRDLKEIKKHCHNWINKNKPNGR